MKKTTYLLLFLLIQSSWGIGQELYFKASSNYHISTATQPMPEYFTYLDYVPLYLTGNDLFIPPVYFHNPDFSIASGFNFQGAIGYSFNDFLSLELGFSRRTNSKTEIKLDENAINVIPGKTDWRLTSYTVAPKFLFSKTLNKSTLSLFLSGGLSFNTLNLKASVLRSTNDSTIEYDFDRTNAFSWEYGIEYDYKISSLFSVFTTVGINNSYYKPHKATLVKLTEIYEFNLNTRLQNINYVDDISNIEMLIDDNGDYIDDPDSPEIRLKETLRLNSVYCGIGIKYSLKK